MFSMSHNNHHFLATQPSLQKVSVNWGLGAVSTGEQQSQPVGGKVMSLLAYKSPAATTKPISIKQCPFIVPPIFDGNHFRIYCLFTGDKLPSSITVTAESPDGPLTVEYNFFFFSFFFFLSLFSFIEINH